MPFQRVNDVAPSNAMIDVILQYNWRQRVWFFSRFQNCDIIVWYNAFLALAL